mmetsp:Transcript_3120/g.7178  ORF Transcript_3120/g.7178 Transcript_3120/m.7178 type:complete len:231 (+) Transcript_3120:790-1482(+)
MVSGLHRTLHQFRPCHCPRQRRCASHGLDDFAVSSDAHLHLAALQLAAGAGGQWGGAQNFGRSAAPRGRHRSGDCLELVVFVSCDRGAAPAAARAVGLHPAQRQPGFAMAEPHQSLQIHALLLDGCSFSARLCGAWLRLCPNRLDHHQLCLSHVTLLRLDSHLHCCLPVRDLSGCPTLVGSCHCSAGHLSAVEAAVQLGGTRSACAAHLSGLATPAARGVPHGTLCGALV